MILYLAGQAGNPDAEQMFETYCPEVAGGFAPFYEPPPPPTWQTDCNSNGNPVKAKNLAFINAHYSDALQLGAEFHIPTDWILAWAAQESGSVNAQGAGQGWGTIGQAGSNQNNFFGMTAVPGAWKGAVECGDNTVAKYACFGSFYDSARAALTSVYGSIVQYAASAGGSAASAFYEVAMAGWDPNNTAYGTNIQSTLGNVSSLEGCWKTYGGMP